MNPSFFAVLALLLVPAGALAAPTPASLFSSQGLLATSSLPGNVYIISPSIVLTTPVAHDLSAVGGTVVIAAPVDGDGLLFGGSVSTRAPIGGDLRAAGGSVSLDGSVGGDLIAFGYTLNDLERAGGSVFIVAMNTTLADGAGGPVTIYGNNVSLGGVFDGDVDIVAAGHVSIVPETEIRGKLTYEAPEPVVLPVSARVAGGIAYTSTAYLPGASASRMLAVASIGVFLLVRILSTLILAGLLAGLFPRPAEEVVSKLVTLYPRRLFLTLALGFAALVATPVFILLLALTFVGIGIALLVGIAYVLLLLLAVIYAGIVIGGLLARRMRGRNHIFWHDGVLGMLLFSAISLIPIAGAVIVFLFTTFVAGALLALFSHYIFPHESKTDDFRHIA